MTKIFKNRVVIMLLCSVLTMAALLLYARSIQTQAEKVTVVRMAANITKGEIITADALETITVGGYNLDNAVMTSMKEVVGNYAATDMVKGSLILKANLSANILTSTDRLEQLDGSRVAYSVSIKEFSNGLSDKLMTGDIISLYINKDGTAISPKELTYVEVLAVTTKKGVDRQDRVNSDEPFATVTLLVTPKQAALLTNYEDNAEIHMALVYRGDKETAGQFIAKQDEVMVNG